MLSLRTARICASIGASVPRLLLTTALPSHPTLFASVRPSSTLIRSSSSAFLPTPSIRSFAVTTAYERRDNTQELLDFETARKDPAKWKKQLLYRSRQRGEGEGGWLELDLIMGTWAEENLANLNQTDLEYYAHVVASENPDLIKYFVEKLPMPEPLASNPIARKLVDYAQIQKKKWTVQTGNQ